ncbi:single-stranded DNA-binding protein [Malikia sp.]|uniref:single-stranded DNA-binding protein n=1 Tax=Malikia sp. TaxID=2070706 RepID=UPI002639B6A0|nr:single-stranded DNA-binding protein [Malikia sp.]MDD2729296.1 single-stranded DNA-binding protein [Malikia sp.]
MIDALVSGKVSGAPTRRTSKNGNTFTTAKVRVPTGEDATFCNVIAFDDGAQAALLALGDGEAVALAGTLKVGTWTAKDGTARPSLDLVASNVLSVYSITKKRRATQPEQAGQQQRQQRQQYRRGDYAADPGELDDGRPLDF